MRHDPQAIMLFAAGFGTRMGALTKALPKPLISVAGKPLIDHALDLVQAQRPLRVVANLHYLPDLLAQHLAPKGVALSLEQPDILETGGGLRHALPLLGTQPVFTLNTDAIWRGPNPLSLLAAHWNPDEMDALLLCIPPAHALGHSGTGDFALAADGRLTRAPGLIYGGAQILKTDRLADIAQSAFSLNLLWDALLADARLFGLSYPGQWCDVGNPEGIALAEGLIGGAGV